jgi:C4-type Zn-finger protein
MAGGGSPTPITDFLFRLEVDSELTKLFAYSPEEALGSIQMPDDARDTILRAMRGEMTLPELEKYIEETEHPDHVAVLIKGFIR